MKAGSFLVALAAISLAGCASTNGMSGTGMPNSDPAVGRLPETGKALSAAGASLVEQGRRERRAGQLAEASATLERAVRVEPDHPAVWQELGQLRFEEGNFAQAEQMGRKALSLAASGSEAHAAARQLIADAEMARRAGI